MKSRQIVHEIYEMLNLYHAGKAVFILKNSQGKVINISDSVERILGLEKKWFIDKRISERIHPSDLSFYLEEANRQNRGVSQTFRFMDGSGQYRLMEEYSIHFRNRQSLATLGISLKDQIKRSLSVIKPEVSLESRKLARSLSKDSFRKFYHKIIDAIPSVVAVVDHFLKVKFINYAGEEFFGKRSSELFSQTFPVALDLSRVGKYSTVVLKEVVSRKDRKHLFEIHTSQIDWNGEPSILLILTDQSDVQQRLRAEVRRKEHEQAFNAKADFVAGMSHEIRTPMNSVIGMASILQTTRLDSEQRDYCRTIKKSGEILLAIINDILDLSKIEAGKMELSSAPIDYYEILSDTMEMFSEELAAKNLEFYYFIPARVPALMGDSVRIRQILINLINNAIKFTSQGYISCVLEWQKKDDDKVQTVFHIADTGVGMKKEDLSSIFSRYTQVGSSEIRHKGTGLGLQIANKLCGAMNGAISVESQENVGSTFSASLDLLSSDKVFQSRDYIGLLKGKKLLYLTSDGKGADFLNRQVTDWGMTLKIFSGEGVFIRYLCENMELSDVILLDYFVNDVCTFDLLNSVKQKEWRQEAKVILVMYGNQGYRGLQLEAEKVGVHYLLRKPFAPTKILRLLAGIVQPSVIEPEQKKRRAEDIVGTGVRKILLVDDNFANQMLGSRLVKKCGHTPLIAKDGQEAVEIFQKGEASLIFMDCQMPVMDGFEATRKIREMEIQAQSGERIPVIALTAGVLSEDSDKCMQAGMDDFLAKPVTLNLFREMLNKWLVKESKILLKQVAELKAIDTVEKYRGFDTDKLREIKNSVSDFPCELFAKKCTSEIYRLKGFVGEMNFRSLEKSAYYLAQMAESVGAVGLEKLCLTLERLAFREKSSQVLIQVEAIEHEISNATEILREHFRSDELRKAVAGIR